MEPQEHRQLIGHYETLLAVVREVAARLRARMEDLRARYPDELSLPDSPRPGEDEPEGASASAGVAGSEVCWNEREGGKPVTPDGEGT